MSTIINIRIDQGASKNIEFLWLDSSTNLPILLNDYRVKFQIKEFYGSEVVLLELSTDNNRISLDGEPGSIVLIFQTEDTANVDWYHGVHELIFIRPDDSVYSFAKGSFVILQKVVS